MKPAPSSLYRAHPRGRSFRLANARGRRVLRAEVNGKPLEEDRVYAVATSGGRTQYLDPKPEATRRPAVEEVIRYVRDRGVIHAKHPETFVEVS